MKNVLYALLLLLVATESLSAIPPVQSYAVKDRPHFELLENGQVIYPAGNEELGEVANWLAAALDRRKGKWLALPDSDTASDRGAIHLSSLAESAGVPYPAADKRFQEAYRMDISENVGIFAGGRAGARYAAQRLLDLFGESGRISAAEIIDYPDYQWRGAVLTLKDVSCGDPVRLKARKQAEWLSCMDKEMEWLESLRLNLLGLISPMFHRLNDTDMHLLRELFERARRRNIEPVPVLNSKLWGIPASVLDVDAVEGVYQQRVLFRANDGVLVSPNAAENLIENGSFDDGGLDGWSIDRSLLASAWKLVEEERGRLPRNSYLLLEGRQTEVPWKNAATPKGPSDNTLIPVEADEYYELGVRVKCGTPHSGRLWISVAEYDESQRRIAGLNRYPVKLFCHKDWRRRWISVFTSEQTRYVALHLGVQAPGDQVAHLAIDDVEFRLMRGQLANVLVNKETAPVVVSDDGKTVYERGLDYELEQAPAREWRDTDFSDIRRRQIRRLPKSRISERQAVRVSFNQLPLEYRAIPKSKYSMGSRYTYTAYREIFAKLHKLDPLFVHVAMSEHAGGLNRDSRSLALKENNRKLLIRYLNTLDLLLRSSESVTLPSGGTMPGVGAADTRMIVWDDMFNPWHNGRDPLFQVSDGGQPGATGLVLDELEDSLNRTIILASWWYRDNDKFAIVENTPGFYRKTGHRYFAATWFQKEGILNWLKVLEPNEAMGLLATTWGKKAEGVSPIACAGWNEEEYQTCLSR